MLDGARCLRPRRARCGRCETTHVLLDACSVARRRDGAEVIGQALLAKAQGDGHRRIAARLGRPPSTVRGWLRRFTRRADLVRAWLLGLLDGLVDDPALPAGEAGPAAGALGVLAALRWTHALNLGREPARPAGSPLTDAVEAIGGAVRECRLQLGIRAGPWELAVALSGGLLCDGARRDPLGI